LLYFFVFFLFFFFFFKQKTAYEIRLSLVGSEMCIRDRLHTHGGLVYAGSGSTAGLTYPHARHLLRSDQSSRPGTAVEGLRLSDRTTEVNVVHHLRVPLLRLQPPLCSCS